MRLANIMCALLVLLGSVSMGGAQSTAASGEVREIKMTAKKYEFDPNTVTVKKGDHVKLIITALDRDHGFKLEAFGINQKLIKGDPTTIEFTADKAGTFPFKCSEFCGLGHGKMKGKLIVEE
ncbi:MAG TPA: cupredoxin domain-containing protein [Terriglobia bacterium]|nr:cupredoxin domain-containing protein [Terriglobia bacterium]